MRKAAVRILWAEFTMTNSLDAKAYTALKLIKKKKNGL